MFHQYKLIESCILILVVIILSSSKCSNDEESNEQGSLQTNVNWINVKSFPAPGSYSNKGLTWYPLRRREKHLSGRLICY